MRKQTTSPKMGGYLTLIVSILVLLILGVNAWLSLSHL